MLLDQNIPLVFRPLRGLLGAYLDEPAPGIIVTTQRPLSVQRFTAAHEFGHAILEHSTSLDDSAILARTPFADRLTYDLQEAAADAFASQLLVPRWLIVKHMLRQNWSRDALQHPEVVYQLSLRMGVSYLATCHAARFHGVIDHSVLRELLGTKPLDIKRPTRGRRQTRDMAWGCLGCDRARPRIGNRREPLRPRVTATC